MDTPERPDRADELAARFETHRAMLRGVAYRLLGSVAEADAALLATGRATELRGADAVAREMVAFGGRSRYAAPALVDGTVGAVVAPHGRLLLIIAITVAGDQVTGYELIADPARLAQVDLAALDGPG